MPVSAVQCSSGSAGCALTVVSVATSRPSSVRSLPGQCQLPNAQQLVGPF